MGTEKTLAYLGMIYLTHEQIHIITVCLRSLDFSPVTASPVEQTACYLCVLLPPTLWASVQLRISSCKNLQSVDYWNRLVPLESGRIIGDFYR